ncbi:hypothetical protein ADEAN_000321000 [Angomonas deanei]|uniref:Uncharacterized protein n=1 Tax=Angomonas deanei TaxID=59799 RepID=A0A7G2CCF0_9TRYP|nr:hypothetical protein ADEAN_000321000 [Angomonas deanei]
MTVFKPIPIEKEAKTSSEDPQLTKRHAEKNNHGKVSRLDKRSSNSDPLVCSESACAVVVESKHDTPPNKEGQKRPSNPQIEARRASPTAPTKERKEDMHQEEHTTKQREESPIVPSPKAGKETLPSVPSDTPRAEKIDANHSSDFSNGIQHHPNYQYQQKLKQEEDKVTVEELDEKVKRLANTIEGKILAQLQLNESLLETEAKNVETMKLLMINQTKELLLYAGRSDPLYGKSNEDDAGASLTIRELDHFEHRITKLVIQGFPTNTGRTASGEEDGGDDLPYDTALLFRSVASFADLETLSIALAGKIPRAQDAIFARWKSFKRIFPPNDDYYHVRQWLSTTSLHAYQDRQSSSTPSKFLEIKLLRVGGFVRKLKSMSDTEIQKLFL